MNNNCDSYSKTVNIIQRREISEYPPAALRELLLNAVVHRDYTSPTDIQIKIFDNAITFSIPDAFTVI